MDTLSLMIEYPFFYEINPTIMLGNSVYYNTIGKKARVILKNFDSD